jgi:serine/threonine protein kinase
MSPEGYISNTYGPKTDVWAFGVMLYELVEGHAPCQDCRTEAELKQRLLKQIDHSSFQSSISDDLKNLIIGCLAISPTSRISL